MGEVTAADTGTSGATMASLLGFELLPVLSESEERVSLAEVLMTRDRSLSDRELWAMCQEACHAIVGVCNSAEVFQMLCVTPDTLAFDSGGAVCFVNLSPEPDMLYVPPEYEEVGNSYKGHIFSLGMTMLYAAGYNSVTDNHSLDLSPELEDVITAMTVDEYDDRSNLEDILELCDSQLHGVCSEDICGQLADIENLDTSLQENNADDSDVSCSGEVPSPCLTLSPDHSDGLVGMDSPTEPLSSSTPSPDNASLTHVTSRDGETSLQDTKEEETITDDQTLPWSVTDDRTLPLSITDDRTLSFVDSQEKLDMSDDVETLEGDHDDGCSTVTSVTMGTEAGDGHRGDGEDDVDMGTLNGDSEDVLLSAVIKNEMVTDGSFQCAADIPKSCAEDIPEDIPGRHIPQDISNETSDNGTHNYNHKDNQDTDRYRDCKNVSDVSDNHKDGPSLSPGHDSHQETERNDRDGTEHTFWEKVERPISGERNISELVISLKSPPPTPVCKVQHNSSSPTETSTETGHMIGSAHSLTASQIAASTVASASLLSTAGVSHAWPHANRRGCRQQCNRPCNVAPESSQGSHYKYVKNGQWSNRAGNSGETKTTVPYHIVFRKKCGATERGVDTSVNLSANTGTRINTPDGRQSDVRGTDLPVDATAATQEMESDVLTLRDLKLQAGGGGRVVPLSQTPTDNIKNPQVVQIPLPQRVGQINDPSVRQINDPPVRKITDKQEVGEIVEQQTVRQILEKLGSELQEMELWALCAECVHALQRGGTQALPGYVSLDTVVITDNGHVDFQEVTEVAELELLYLAPELQKDGVITEKTCLFGIAVLLWMAADYKMPTNHEPALSEEFENLLISMTQDIADLRPMTSAILQVCENYQRNQDVTSTFVCQMLASEARKAEAFGKTNVLVRDILEEALEHDAVSQKAQLMDSIKAAQLQLKPVSDRQLAEIHIEKCLHECLMEEIKQPLVKLRKCRQPRLRSVRALFQSDSRLLHGLVKVTSGATDHSRLQHFQPSSGSAFSLVNSQKQGMGNRQRRPNEYSSVPSALNSSATHFQPIVLTPTGDVKRREMPKIPAMSDAEREQKVARKLEELKMNVRRNQLPLHFATDLERETPTEAKFVSELKVGKVGEAKQEGGSPRSGSGSRLGEGSPRALPQPGRARQGYYQGQTQGRHDIPMSPVKNGQFSYGGTSESHVMSPCHQRWGSDDAQYQGAFTSPVHSSPGQGQPDSLSPLGQFSQGYIPQQMAPQQPFPMAAPFPFQVQLQQDPRTGFFQMIPVPMPGIPHGTMPVMPHTPGMMPAYSMPVIPTPSPPQPTLEHQYQANNQPKQSLYRPQGATTEGWSHGVKGRIRSTKVQRLRTVKTGETEGVFDKLNDTMERDSKQCLRLEEAEEARDNSEEGSDTEMASNRRRRDWKSNLKRAKSGSHIDYQYNEVDIDVSPPSAFSRTIYRSSLRLENGLSRSQPNIGGHQLAVYENGETKLTSQKKLDYVSPDDLCSSPPPSPSWSKDSGVSGVNMKGSADATLMERLLNGDTAKHQKLMRVIQLIRDEFAFDGYMENGIEDLAMGEYILSLGSLKWETFQGAVTEKYCDLYWQDELMTRLYEAVNGHKPITVSDQRGVIRKMRTKQPKTPPAGDAGEPDRMSLLRGGVTRRQRPVSDIHDIVSRPSPVTTPFVRSPRRASDGQEWEDDSQSKASESSTREPRKPGSCLRRSNADSGGTGDIHSINGNYDRSVSMSNIYTSANGRNDRLRSQNAVHLSHGALNGLVESSTDDVDDAALPGGEMPNLQMPNATIGSTCDLHDVVSTSSNNTRKLGQFKSHSTYFVYPRDSESSSINSARSRQPCSDLDTNGQSSNSSVRSSSSNSSNCSCLTRGKALLSARSESHLATAETARHAGSVQRRLDKGSVVYYHAEMTGRARVSDPAYEPDSKTKAGIEAKMAELNQHMIIEHRNRRKTQEYYRKLVEATKANSKVSSEHKASMAKVLKEMKETTQKLDHFDSCMKHLEMLYAEQWGLGHELLYALANCPGDEPMLLAPCDNILVQYQTLSLGGMGGQVLQAGMPLGLMAYLFAQHALSDGYIHQFFYCYRYFTSPCQLLRFIVDKFTAATESLSPDASIPVKIKARALDLLQVWLEGYYGVDFRHSPELSCSLRTFLKTKVVPVDASAESLLELIELCEEGRQVDLAYPDFHATPGIAPYETRSLDDNQPVKKTSAEFESEAGTEWESFKAAMHFSAKPAKLQQRSKSTRKLSMNGRCEDSYPKRGVSRTELFSLADHTAQILAEQLTLMEQEFFQLSHPVSYLNSKARGVSVDLANPVIHKTHSRVSMAWEDVQGSSLFVHTDCSDNVIQRLIDHAQNIACWVAAEIVSCNSIKVQVNVLSRFIEMARVCRDLRNFAVCVAILDGLENILVRQLPAWRSLPSKSKSVIEELAAVRIFLKTDAMCLTSSTEERSRPTIPCILLLLLHVQQLEIGGFTLANGMYKWTKLKKLCQVVDQIRHFKQIPYHYTPDTGLQALLRQRIEELSQQDIHALAAQHDSNVHKISSGGGIQGALRRMRNKFQ